MQLTWHNPNRSRFYTFPSYIENTTFGISCDALANMKVRSVAMYVTACLPVSLGHAHQAQANGRDLPRRKL